MDDSNSWSTTPLLSQILDAVAQASGIDAGVIRSRGREARVVMARSAFYAVALHYGYSRLIAVDYLNLNRTAIYHFDYNLEWRLSADEQFISTFRGAVALLDGTESEPENDEESLPEPVMQIEPQHSINLSHSGTSLGFPFTDDDLLRMEQVCLASIEYMQHYGQPPCPYCMIPDPQPKAYEQQPT